MAFYENSSTLGVDMIYNKKLSGTKRDQPELAKLVDRTTEGKSRTRDNICTEK